MRNKKQQRVYDKSLRKLKKCYNNRKVFEVLEWRNCIICMKPIYIKHHAQFTSYLCKSCHGILLAEPNHLFHRCVELASRTTLNAAHLQTERTDGGTEVNAYAAYYYRYVSSK